jgi:hypothetical protein
MKRILIYCLLFISSLITSAQSSSLFVDSLKVIPANPTESDSVTFVAYTWHPYLDALYGRTIVKQDSIISIYSCWHAGFFPAAENVNDTIH